MGNTYKIRHTETQGLEQDGGNHLSLETLDSYHRDVFRPQDKVRIQLHLLECRDCREALLDLSRFLADCSQPGRLWSAELTAAWEEWRASLDVAEVQEHELEETRA